MAQVRAHLRSLLHATDDLVSIMDTINRFLAEDLDDNLFVTMLLVKLEPASGRCTYVNSAHPSAYVVDPSGEIAAEMSSVCLPLGFFRDRWRCTEHTVVLGEGDTMVLVTDGILESENPSGEEFGAERLLATLRQNGSRCAQEIVDQIRGAVREFVGGGQQTDDLTIVICKRLASSDSV